MKKWHIRGVLIMVSWTAVLYPVLVRVVSLEWAPDRTLVTNLFPLFGLAAFGLLWLHIVGAAIEGWLRKYINFEKFIEKTSNLILALMLLHPLLLLMSVGFKLGNVFLIYGTPFVMLGIIGLVLLLVFDLGRVWRSTELVEKHWEKILAISTLGFILIFFHSLKLGSDLQSDPLRTVWIFYGVTAILSAVHVYIVKPLLK